MSVGLRVRALTPTDINMINNIIIPIERKNWDLLPKHAETILNLWPERCRNFFFKELRIAEQESITFFDRRCFEIYCTGSALQVGSFVVRVLQVDRPENFRVIQEACVAFQRFSTLLETPEHGNYHSVSKGRRTVPCDRSTDSWGFIQACVAAIFLVYCAKYLEP